MICNACQGTMNCNACQHTVTGNCNESTQRHDNQTNANRVTFDMGTYHMQHMQHACMQHRHSGSISACLQAMHIRGEYHIQYAYMPCTFGSTMAARIAYTSYDTALTIRQMHASPWKTRYVFLDIFHGLLAMSLLRARRHIHHTTMSIVRNLQGYREYDSRQTKCQEADQTGGVIHSVCVPCVLHGCSLKLMHYRSLTARHCNMFPCSMILGSTMHMRHSWYDEGLL